MFGTLFFKPKSAIRVTNLNDVYVANGVIIDQADKTKIINLKNIKRLAHSNNGRLFVLDFVGDVMASQAEALSQEVNAILAAGNPNLDQVLIRLESPGGAVHVYGYASSQLQRIRNAGYDMTVAVDKVAASGGYMMACIAHNIISAPYAIVGSIGVVSEFMNFNTLLESIGINYKQYTAGKYKRTVGPLGPITVEAEAKFNSDLDRVHRLFKDHVKKFRNSLDIDEIATGEYWYGLDAKERGLVDQILPSDDFIIQALSKKEVLHIQYIPHRSFGDKLRLGFVKAIKDVALEMISTYMHLRL